MLGNIGPVLPQDNYLREIRAITKAHDVLLIFDEVITGYRLGIGGAQVKYGVKPDLTTLGKIIGGGLPIGAFGGRREIMETGGAAGPGIPGRDILRQPALAHGRYGHPRVAPRPPRPLPRA